MPIPWLLTTWNQMGISYFQIAMKTRTAALEGGNVDKSPAKILIETEAAYVKPEHAQIMDDLIRQSIQCFDNQVKMSQDSGD